MEDRLFDIFLEIFEAATQRNTKLVSSNITIFNGWYKKANVQEQSTYHQKVAEFMKTTIS